MTQMAVGDGLADIVGRKWGSVKWPFSKSKSLVGSGAFLLGSFTISAALLLLLQVMSYKGEVLILKFFTTFLISGDGLSVCGGLVVFALAAAVEAAGDFRIVYCSGVGSWR